MNGFIERNKTGKKTKMPESVTNEHFNWNVAFVVCLSFEINSYSTESIAGEQNQSNRPVIHCPAVCRSPST